ncbi:MAG: universal stress protein [Candidatus Nanopelagicales bacterium]
MSTIVVGFVAKPEGRAAVRRGIEEARLRGSRIVVVSSARGGSSLDSETAIELDKDMEAVHNLLHESGIEHEVRQLIRGQSPAEDLISVAEDEGAELIVIGLRRRTPVGKLIMGSNAQQVLLDANCPVLAVKAGSDD